MQAVFHQAPLNDVYGDQAAEKLIHESSKSQGYIRGTLNIILGQNKEKIIIKNKRGVCIPNTPVQKDGSAIFCIFKLNVNVYDNMKLRLRSKEESKKKKKSVVSMFTLGYMLLLHFK